VVDTSGLHLWPTPVVYTCDLHQWHSINLFLLRAWGAVALSVRASYFLLQGWRVTHVHQEGKAVHLQLSFFRIFKLRYPYPYPYTYHETLNINY